MDDEMLLTVLLGGCIVIVLCYGVFQRSRRPDFPPTLDCKPSWNMHSSQHSVWDYISLEHCLSPRGKPCKFNSWLNILKVPTPLQIQQAALAVQVHKNAPLATKIWSKLPTEILEEQLLPRLPLITLARFRCVCSKWRNLVSSVEFLKRHSALGTADPYRYWISIGFPRIDHVGGLEYLSYTWHFILRMFFMRKCLRGLFFDPRQLSVHVQSMEFIRPSRDCLITSTNGLVTVFDQTKVTVLNPLNSRSRSFYRRAEIYCMFYGMAWNSVEEDYAVVEGFFQFELGFVYYGKRRCRSFRIPLGPDFPIGQGTEFEHRIYWPCDENRIIGYSLWSEEWLLVDGPSGVMEIRCLFNWNGSLYLIPASAEEEGVVSFCWRMVVRSALFDRVLWQPIQVVPAGMVCCPSWGDSHLEVAYMETKKWNERDECVVSPHTDIFAFDKLHKCFVHMSNCQHLSFRTRERWSLTSFQPSLATFPN